MRIHLSIQKGSLFFRDNDKDIAICSEGLYDWFDFPEDVREITLDVSREATYDHGEESVVIYYYPAACTCFQYDTYGLTKDFTFERLNVLDKAMEYIVQQMALPPQGVLYVSLEYTE